MLWILISIAFSHFLIQTRPFKSLPFSSFILSLHHVEKFHIEIIVSGKYHPFSWFLLKAPITDGLFFCSILNHLPLSNPKSSALNEDPARVMRCFCLHPLHSTQLHPSIFNQIRPKSLSRVIKKITNEMRKKWKRQIFYLVALLRLLFRS